MQYNKINMDQYNLHIIKTDKFKSNFIKLTFKRKTKKEEITLRNMLGDILLESNKKYPTKREIEIKQEELYGVGIQRSSFMSGSYSVLSFSLDFLNEKYTESGMNEKTIEFFLELLLNPNIKNDQFDSQSFKFCKAKNKEYIESINDNPDLYALIRLNEELGKDTPLELHVSGYLDDLEKITEKSLYQYYQDVLENDIMDIFIVGNIEIDEIKKILSRFKFREKSNSESDNHFVKLNKVRKPVIINEKKNFEQTRLLMGFKIDELTDFEKKYVLSAYNFILGGGNDSQLFREVREKNSLCYYITSNSSALFNTLWIKSGINYDDKDKAIKLINKALENIKKGEFTDTDLKEVKTIYTAACKNIIDSPYEIITNYLCYEYFGFDLIEDRIKNIKKVTRDDIIRIAHKMNLDVIYTLEGGTNEKDTDK